MTKGTKKTNRRLKKTVRKTLGTLFLISAIVVAAIPTEGLRAEEEIATQAASHTHQTTHSSSKYKVTIPKDASEKASLLSGSSTIPTMDTLIPVVDRNATIYTTETNTDGTSYQFAYVNYKNSWCAVLLGYNKNTTLTGNVLDIPDMVNAYIQPTSIPGIGVPVLSVTLPPTQIFTCGVPYMAVGGSPFFCFSQAVENPSSVSNRKDRRFLMRFFMAGAGLWLLSEI